MVSPVAQTRYFGRGRRGYGSARLRPCSWQNIRRQPSSFPGGAGSSWLKPLGMKDCEIRFRQRLKPCPDTNKFAGGEGKGYFAGRRFESCRGRESA
jgi:hypothetical protein